MIRNRLPPTLDEPGDRPARDPGDGGGRGGANGSGGDGARPVDSGGPAGDGGRAKSPPPRGEQSEFTRHVILFNTLALHARAVLESVQNGTYSIEEQAAAIELVRGSLESAWGELERSDVPRQYVHDVAKLGLHWGALQANEVLVSPTEERDANAERIGLNQAIESCASITREAMYAIALDRLYAWVRVQEPEYAVDLHAVLRDEIPDRADREDVIAWLSSAPRVLSSVGGIIEPETGLIYRTYDRWLARAARVVLVAVVLAGTLVATRSLAPFVLGEAPGAAGEAAGGVVAIDGGDSLEPITSETQLLISWVACVLGLLAHSVLTTYRSIRSGRLNGTFPIRRATILLSARSGVILLRLVSTWVAFIALMVLVGHDAEVSLKIGLLTAFLIGYGSDAFIDTVTGMLETRSASTIQRLRDAPDGSSAPER